MFWINPLAWAFRAAVLNEFQSPEYEDECVETDLDGVCTQHLGEVNQLLITVFFVVPQKHAQKGDMDKKRYTCSDNTYPKTNNLVNVYDRTNTVVICGEHFQCPSKYYHVQLLV